LAFARWSIGGLNRFGDRLLQGQGPTRRPRRRERFFAQVRAHGALRQSVPRGPETLIEDIVGATAEQVRQGKVRDLLTFRMGFGITIGPPDVYPTRYQA
jgi:hypothetical protein